MMQYDVSSPIETEFGILSGRDAIYLNDFFYNGGSLIVVVVFNGRLGSKPSNSFPTYRITFVNVLAFTVYEGDTWAHLGDALEASNYYERENVYNGFASSFDEITNSIWLRDLGKEVTPDHKHYQLATYDDIINVACESMEMILLAAEE